MQQILLAKYALATSLIVAVVLMSSYMAFEPQLVRAVTNNVQVTLTVDNDITISAGADINMSPNLGLAVATSTGSTSWTVVTNDPDGYTLGVQATGTPALQDGANTIDDYTEAVAATPDAWNIPDASNTAEFGYSAYGTDVSTGEYGTDGACDAPPLTSANRLYEGFTTSDNTIATRSSTTTPAGITTTLCVAVEQVGSYTVPSGTYTGEIVATALVQ